MDFSGAKTYSPAEATEPGCYSYLECDTVIIDKYVPSRLEASDVCLAQDELPGGGTVIYFEREYFGTLALRIPADPSVRTSVSIDGEDYTFAVAGVQDQPRYALIAGPFEPGCRVKLEIRGAAPKTFAAAPEKAVEASAEEATDTASAPDKASAEEAAVVPDASAAPSEPIIAPAVPYDATLILPKLRADNAAIYFNDSKSRFYICPQSDTTEIALHLPEGYEFETADYESDTETQATQNCLQSVRNDLPADKVSLHSFGNSLTIALADTLFTGMCMRVYTSGQRSCRDYDVAIKRAASGASASGCEVHAYTPITGAFSGEACYIIDHTGTVTEGATHGTLEDPALCIDPVTGYKWGRDTDGSLFFELENGGYEITAAFTGEGARLIANPGTASERVLVRETSSEAQHYGFRVTDGSLVLRIVEDPSVDIKLLVIRALDTIAVESGYVPVSGVPHAPSGQGAGSFTASFTPLNLNPGASAGLSRDSSAASGSTVTAKSKAKTNSGHKTSASKSRYDAVQARVNSELAARKANEAAKTAGIAAGAIALAGGLIALLKKDK